MNQTDAYAILYRKQDGTLYLGAPHKTPECAALGVSAFEGAEVLGTVALLPEPVMGMHYRIAAQPPKAEPDPVELDNAKAADSAALAMIGMGYAWDGDKWYMARTATPTAAADSERLDWLAHHGAAMRNDDQMEGGGWFVLAPYHTGISSVDGLVRFPSSREAIDAAMHGDAARNQEAQG